MVITKSNDTPVYKNVLTNSRLIIGISLKYINYNAWAKIRLSKLRGNICSLTKCTQKSISTSGCPSGVPSSVPIFIFQFHAHLVDALHICH